MKNRRQQTATQETMEQLSQRQKTQIFALTAQEKSRARAYWTMHVCQRDGSCVFPADGELRPLGAFTLVIQHGMAPTADCRYERCSVMSVKGQATRRTAAYTLPLSWVDLSQRFTHTRRPTTRDTMNIRMYPLSASAALDAYACRMQAANNKMLQGQLPTAPTLPEVYWGFFQDTLPEYVVTPALRNLVRVRVGSCDDGAMATHGPELFRQLGTPPQAALPCGAVNNTDFVLYPAAAVQLDGQPVPRAIAAFESIRPVLGATVTNPFVRGQLAFANPARAVSRELRLPLDILNSAPTQAQLTAMAAGMRDTLGAAAAAFSDDDLIDAMRDPDSPLYASRLAGELPDEQLVAVVDEILPPYYRGGATAADVREAAASPSLPLRLSRASRMEVLRTDRHLTRQDAMQKIADMLAVPVLLYADSMADAKQQAERPDEVLHVVPQPSVG